MRRAIINLVPLFFATASLAQPVTTQWDISNSRAQCAANVPLVGAGAGASPACWMAALGSIAAVVPGTGVNAALALNVGSAGAPVLFDGLGGTPTAIDLTHGTNLPVSTGVGGLASGVAAFLAAPSSANLRAAMTDESGTGALIFAGGNVGAATATSINGNVITTGTGTLTLGAGKTLTVSNSVTFTAASDGLTVNFPTSDTVVMLGGAQTFSGGKTFLAGTLILNGTGGASQVLKQASSGAAVTVGQLAFSDISGIVAASQLPNPSASTLGGVQSAAAVSHQWINSISTSGVPALSQPAFTDISGSVATSQMPAFTGGDVTTSAGSVVATIGANKVTRAMQAQGLALSVVGVAGNAGANVADIQGTANQAMRVNSAGTALAFGAIDLTQSASAALAFTNYTPTVASTTNTLTTTTITSAGSATVGNLLYVQHDFTLTTIGTGAGFLDVSVPTYASIVICSYYETNNGNGMASATVPDTTHVRIKMYNNGVSVVANNRFQGGCILRVS